jgi:hypothetical protein
MASYLKSRDVSDIASLRQAIEENTMLPAVLSELVRACPFALFFHHF